MVDLNKDDVALITQAIAIGFSPAGVALDVADLARASYNLYQEKTDDHYFEVILCIIGFIPGPGDGLKAGLRIVNRRPEILFELVRFIMAHCKIYGDPEKWLSEVVSDKTIRSLIQKAKREALTASNKNIDNKWVKYWINQSIEITFNFIEASVSSLIQLLARKILHWKARVPKTSAMHTGNNARGGRGHGSRTANNTTYNGKTGQNGNGQGNKGRSLSKADISKVLTNLDVGGVGEHMADYWVAKQLAVSAVHDSGQQLPQKLQRIMTRLHIGVNDQGIDAIWRSDKKNIGIMNTKTYAIIEAKASLSMGVGKGPGSLLLDSDKQQDNRDRRREREDAQREKRAARKLTPKKKYFINQQMSDEWIKHHLRKTPLVIAAGFSKHLLYFNYAHPETVEHLNVLALSIQNAQPINHREHLNGHSPSNFWGAAKIDEALNKRVTSSNLRNGHSK